MGRDDGNRSLDLEIEELKDMMTENQSGIRINLRAQLLHIACQFARIDGRRHSRMDIVKIYSALCESIGSGGYVAPGVELQITENNEYKNIINDFIDECCSQEKYATTNAKDLYLRFVNWYRENKAGDIPTNTWFGRLMGERFAKHKSNGRVVYRMIKIKN
jgi:translation initiation factor 1 (eIF-1/SUI1)